MEYIKCLDEDIYKHIEQGKATPELLNAVGINNINKQYYVSKLFITCKKATQPGQVFTRQTPNGLIYYIILHIRHKNSGICECLSIY